jgi:hypothetical protein
MNIAYFNLSEDVFISNMKMVAILLITLTIAIFEIAYKKDSGELTIYGIESLIVSICTLMTIYIG